MNDPAITCRKKQGTKLYNILFPIWMLVMVPSVWLIALPVNFVVDSAVLLIMFSLLAKKRGETDYRPWGDWVRSIWLTWILGFVSDIIAAGFLLFWGMGPSLIMGDLTPAGAAWSSKVAEPIMANPFESIWAVLFVLISIALGGLLIYFFNKNVALRLTRTLDIPEIKRTALVMAVVTAPWTMLLPSEWFW